MDNTIRDEIVNFVKGMNITKEQESTFVKDHADIQGILKKHDQSACFACFSPNCQAKWSLCKKLNLPFTSSECNRKIIKFRDAKEKLKLAAEARAMKSRPRKGKLATKMATITVIDEPNSTIMNHLESFMEEENEESEYGYVPSPSFNMKAKVRFSEADIPDIAAWRAAPDTQD